MDKFFLSVIKKRRILIVFSCAAPVNIAKMYRDENRKCESYDVP